MRLSISLVAALALLGLRCDPAPAAIAGACPADYPDPATSPYVLPYPVGEAYETGLTNCSASFHGPGQPDALAFDFDMPVGAAFVAARAGVVAALDEDEPSAGGGPGNYVLLDHGDGTHAYYLHSPADGIEVEVGQRVAQGERLGVTGRSGLAGYPHLHFIVVTGDPSYPYTGVAVSFRNAAPRDRALAGDRVYEARPY